MAINVEGERTRRGDRTGERDRGGCSEHLPRVSFTRSAETDDSDCLSIGK